MSKQNEEFVGHLMTFDKKGEGEEVIDENILLEVTEFWKDGRVEIAFTDRNERCYVQFNLSDLMTHISRAHGSELSS